MLEWINTVFNFFCTMYLLTLCQLVSSAVTFANSLDPDQARQNVGPDLDPNCLTLDGIPEFFFKKVDFLKKNQQTTKKSAKLPSRQSTQ